MSYIGLEFKPFASRGHENALCHSPIYVKARVNF